MAFASPGFLLWRTSSISTSTQYREISESSSSDVIAIKDVLHAQQQLLHKLYAELDEERDLSSSAANEAMSMIIRLQEEKSRLKMDASQYKREAEEKMCIAEESLEIFEDLIEAIESEIASLEYQIQAYKAKLLEMGYSDLNIPDCYFSDSPQAQLHRNDSGNRSPLLYRAESGNRSPQLHRNDSGANSTETSPRPPAGPRSKKLAIPIPVKLGSVTNGDTNVYREKIKKLEEQVRKISSGDDGKSLKSRFRSCSLPPPDTQVSYHLR